MLQHFVSGLFLLLLASQYFFGFVSCASICVYGGGNRKEQLQKVKKGVEIVVATPGRLNDFMMNGIINVKHVTYLVRYL